MSRPTKPFSDPELRLDLPTWMTWPSRHPGAAMVLVLVLWGIGGWIA
ncbi:MAG: hypothetical protein V4739_04710 [Pseudomonadota bacterium]